MEQTKNDLNPFEELSDAEAVAVLASHILEEVIDLVIDKVRDEPTGKRVGAIERLCLLSYRLWQRDLISLEQRQAQGDSGFLEPWA